MRNSNFAVAAFGLASVLIMPALVQAAPDEVAVPIRGLVVSVGKNPASVVLRFTPPGSQPATKRTFELADHNDVLRLHAGQMIDGTADETRKIWVLSNVNIETSKPPHGDVGP